MSDDLRRWASIVYELKGDINGGELTEQIRRYHEFMRYGDSLSGEAEERCQRIEGTNFTRGHYFRGVL